MDPDTLDAFTATWERARALDILLRAKLDALVFLLTEELKLEYEPFMEKLRFFTEQLQARALEKEEDRDPAFAARVRAWLDRELPNFPLDRPPTAGPPPSANQEPDLK